jgi:excisionase family DNA binding protein
VSNDRLLTAREVADLLAVPERWIRDASRDGRIPVVRLGRYRRYDRADVLAWLSEQKSEGRTTTFRTRVPVDELVEHLARTPFKGADERVFVNPRTGHPFGDDRYKEILTLALARAGIDGVVRPSHDLRHSSITNSAAAGTKPEALMARAGHSSYSTIRRYIDLAGESFREEADRLEERLWGGTGTANRYQAAPPSPDQETEEAAAGLVERRD